MSSSASVLALLLLLATPAAPDDGYGFRLSVVTTGDALKAIDPKLYEAHVSRGDASRRLNDPVMLFERRAGVRWRATMFGCPKAKPDCEFGVNVSGTGGVKAEANEYDLGFSKTADGVLRTRCLRPACRIRYSAGDEQEVDVTLTRDETRELRLPVEIAITFP